MSIQVNSSSIPLKILVIDDEPLLKSIFEQKFRPQIKNNQLFFLYASNGVEAIEILAKNPDIGVFFTDLNMPQMDGISLLRLLHDQKPRRLYRPVIISAYGDMANIREAMNWGATDFITKPVDLKDLEKTLIKTIDQYLYIKQGVDAQERMIEIQKELGIAKSIQRSYMTYDFQPFPGDSRVTLYGESLDPDKIGGEYFDFFPLDDHRLAIAAATIPDAGIPAAMRMMMLRTLIRNVSFKTLTALETIRQVNHIVYEDEYSKIVPISAFYGVLDINTGELQSCIAGAISPYLLSEGSLLALGKMEAGPPLGKSDDLDKQTSLYPETINMLKPGDMIFCATRAASEIMNMHFEMYTEMRLQNQILKDLTRSPEKLVKDIKESLKEFADENNFTSNLTLFCLRYEAFDKANS